MCDRGCELDVTHTVTPHFRQRDLDAAFFTNDAAILHTLVLAAQAFVILDRAKDASAKQPVTFGFERPIVDSLRLFDLAVRPGADALRARDRDTDQIEALRPTDLAKDVHQLIHERSLSELIVISAQRITKAGGLTSTHNPGTTALPGRRSRIPKPAKRETLTRYLG